MKTALLALALLLGCASTPPSQLVLPQGQVREGVRINVTKIAGSWTRPHALVGTVENLSGEPIRKYSLRLDALGYMGSTVGRAYAEIEGLAAGEVRSFRAKFAGPSPTGLHQVMIGAARAQH